MSGSSLSMQTIRLLSRLVLAALALFILTTAAPGVEPVKATPLASPLRISQVYGGGGNSSATYQCDFVELFNASASATAISNYSIQYAPAGSVFSFAGTIASATIPAGGYYLIQMYCPTSPTGSPLPTPDLTLSMSTSGGMSTGAGKVALVNNTTLLTCGGAAGNCFPNANLVDFVGYDSANNYEGSSAAPGPSNNTIAVLRNNAGCTDTDQNGSNLAVAAVNPRNSSSSTNNCSEAILVVTKSASESSVSPGDVYAYTIQVQNVGSAAASGVTVSDDFDETRLDVLNSSPATTSFDSGTQAASWSIGALAAGASTSVVVDVNVLGGASGTISNLATATGTGLGVASSYTTSVSIAPAPTPSAPTNGSNTCGSVSSTAAEGPGFCDATTGPGAEAILLSMNPCRAAGRMCFWVDVQGSESLTIHSNATTAVGNLTTTPHLLGVAGTATNHGDATGVLDTAISVPASGVDQYKVCFEGTGGEVRDLYIKFDSPTGATGRIHSDAWCMTNKTFCPTCKFDFTVLARCGETLRLPFNDFENMTGLKVYKPGAGGAPSTATLAAVSIKRQGASPCTYWSHPGGDPASTSGTYDGSYCGKPIPAVNSDNDAVTWYDGDAVNLSNARTNEEFWGNACYSDPPPDPTTATGFCAGSGLCEAGSPGDSNYNSQAQLYLEIDLSNAANGCGAYTLQSDRATGYNWSLQSFCYDGSTQLGAQQIYFDGAAQCGGGHAPALAATSALPELIVDTTLEIQANGSLNLASCSGGIVDAPVTVRYNLANPSCGAATGPWSNAFTISDADTSNNVTHSNVATLASYGERIETVDTTVQCACSGGVLTGGVLQVTSTTLDSTGIVSECSEGSNAVNCLSSASTTQSAATSCLTLWSNAGVPLAATLAEFGAVQQGPGILVSWDTVSELNNLGFNLWRGTTPNAPDQQLNASLIPSAAPGSGQGFHYEWLDQADLVNNTTYYYWLEDMDISGQTTRHGPVSATYEAPTAVRLSGANVGWSGSGAALLLCGAAGLLALARRR